MPKIIKSNTATSCFIANYHNSLSDAEAIRQLAKMGITFEK